MKLCVDWGSSNRRAVLLDDTSAVTASHEDDQGVFVVNTNFETSLNVLKEKIGCHADTDVLMSGMIGSRSGWMEAPYLRAPVLMEELREQSVEVPGTRVRIVPGVSWSDGPDVMRGEETQILGAMLLLGDIRGSGLYLLPGTHSKWVLIEKGRLIRFRTYMTGELFSLVRSHGSLAPVVNAGTDDGDSFEDGLRAAVDGLPLSSALFSLRASVLLGKIETADAQAFLSGLLIGTEWNDRANAKIDPSDGIRLICAPHLSGLYLRAAAFFGYECTVISPEDAFVSAVRFIGGPV